jgi:hypothetical protein
MKFAKIIIVLNIQNADDSFNEYKGFFLMNELQRKYKILMRK